MVEGRFGKWLGKTSVSIGGEEFELDVRLKDLEGLMSAFAMQKDPNRADEAFAKISKTLMEVFKRSYPDAKVEELDAFLLRNYLEALEKLTIAFGLVKEADIQKFRGPGK